MSDQSPAVHEAAPSPRPKGNDTVEIAQSSKRWRSKVWSNLNLNGPVPARVRPAIGEWGPERLPSTKQKKRARWLTPVIFTLALIAVTLTGWYFWTIFR